MGTDGYMLCFNHIPKYSDYNGKAYLLPSNSLRLIDSRRRINILDRLKNEKISIQTKSLHENNEFNQFIFNISNVLNSKQCMEIIDKFNESLDMQSIQYSNTRKNKRFVVFDAKFASYLWKAIEKELRVIFKEKNVDMRPLGFSVTKGSWDICGLNEAMRFNRYDSSSNDKFGIHRDAQFCPSGDTRSIMSLVIYLNDDFIGGETKFYLAKNMNTETKGMNINEEIVAHGGLSDGFNEITVVPNCGDAVLFSQSVLHESLLLTSSKKYIIKTDIMVTRKPSLGFKLHQSESEDFFQCLNYFRTAQQNEMKGNNLLANELYEKCLSIRYSYPKLLVVNETDSLYNHSESLKLLSESQDGVISTLSDNFNKIKGPNAYKIFPYEIWFHIFKLFLEENDVYSLVEVFPCLEDFKRPFDEKKITPTLEYSCGVFSEFSFECENNFVKNNLEAFCRVLGGYAIYLLGQSSHNSYYIVNYEATENEVTLVPMEKFLASLFYKESSYGSTYKVRQCDDFNKQLSYDFEQSVERSYMMLKHNKEFMGIDIESEYKCKGEVHDVYHSDDEDDENVEENDNKVDDDTDDKYVAMDDTQKENSCNEKVDQMQLNCQCIHDDSAKSTESNNSIEIANETNRIICQNGNNKTLGDEMQNECEKINHSSGNINNEITQTLSLPNDISYRNNSPEYCNFQSLPYKTENIEILVKKYVRLYDNVTNTRIDYSEEKTHSSLMYEDDALTKLYSVKPSYIDGLHKTISYSGNGGAVVRYLRNNGGDFSFMKSDEHCECGMHSDTATTCYATIDIPHTPLNHLIFDFSKQKLQVSRNIPENDVMFNHLVDRVKEELVAIHYWSEDAVLKIKKFHNAFCINISSLSKSDLSFNHASCQCSFPGAKMKEYVNLQSYPHIKNVYVIFVEVEPWKMNAWCCYGGIVAM